MNNRILKFRFWSISKKKFINIPIVWVRMDGQFGCDNEEDLIIQQFTGLLDKSGKEIYEGDVLIYRYSWFNENSEIEPIEDNVEVVMRFGQWLGENQKEQIMTGLYGNKENLVIVGNIFEQKT